MGLENIHLIILAIIIWVPIIVFFDRLALRNKAQIRGKGLSFGTEIDRFLERNPDWQLADGSLQDFSQITHFFFFITDTGSKVFIGKSGWKSSSSTLGIHMIKHGKIKSFGIVETFKAPLVLHVPGLNTF
jgi:hypothetical protein